MDIRRFGAAVPEPRVHARAELRELRDLLRHPLPERGATGRAAAPRLAGLFAARRPRRRLRGEGVAGSARTGSSPTPRARASPTRPSLEALRPRGWAGEHWSPAIGAEALATRTTAALFDETLVREDRGRRPGRRARSCSGCARTTSTATVGSVTYTQLLNRRGGIECDLTVTRVDRADRFLLVTGTAFGNHDLAWIRRHAPRDGSVVINDLTSGARLLRAVGPAGPRHPGRRPRPTTSPTRPSRT